MLLNTEYILIGAQYLVDAQTPLARDDIPMQLKYTFW